MERWPNAAKRANEEVMQVQTRMTGRSYHASDAFPAQITLPEQATLADALKALDQQNDGALNETMLVLVDGRHVGTVASYPPIDLHDGCEIEFLAPVAGG